MNAQELAKPAIAAVRDGKTKFVPKNWENTYFNWMENIQPWCISRQLWWGHQIPAWYGPDGKVFVALSEGRSAGAKPTSITASRPTLTRDEDVLDTWFSSALWPFSTLGWPDKTPELARFYPTSALVTGFDIIFFWVARMMMMGLHFMKEVPFHDVYIHRLVRDASGAKMSKSKGNVVDPLGVIDEYGADALRFTLARNVAPGPRHPARAAGRREQPQLRDQAVERGALCRVQRRGARRRLRSEIREGNAQPLDRARNGEGGAPRSRRRSRPMRFNDAAGAAYRFVWNVYCDWYVELSKPLLTGPDGAAKDETRAMAAWALDEILKLLHPFMPFITEELWAVTAEQGPKRASLLALSATGPQLDGLADDKAEAEIGWVIDLITAIRSVRAEMNITAPIPLVLAGASAETQARARALGRVHQAAGARVGDFLGAERAAGLGAARRARRSGGAAAQGRHRSCRRARAACQGNAEGRSRHRARRRQARTIRISSSARRKRWSRRRKKSARRRSRARPRSPRRWSGSRRGRP